MADSTEKIQLVITARDLASKDVGIVTQKLGGLQNKMLDMTHSARLMKRETFGVSKFAGALDTVAGTNFGNVISDMLTVAEVAHPLQELGGAIAGKVADAWGAVPGSAKVTGAIKGAASKMSSALSSEMGMTAGAVGIGVVGAIIIDQWAQEMAKKISALRAQVVTELGNDPLAAKKIQDSLGPWRGFIDITGQALENLPVLGAATGQIGADIRGLVGDVDTATVAFTGLQGEMKHAFSEHADSNAADATRITQTFLNSLWAPQIAAHAAQEHADEYAADSAKATGVAFDKASTKFADVMKGPMKSALVLSANEAANAGGHALADNPIWDKSAHAIGSNLAKALRDAKPSVRSAMQDLNWAINHPFAEANKKRLIEAKLTSQKLAKALASKNPEIHDQAAQTQQTLIDLWQSLTGKAYSAGTDASTALANTLNDKYPTIQKQAKAFVTRFNEIFAALRLNYKVNVDVARGVSGKVGHLPTFAAGGDADAGTTALVGEKGPEVVTFGRDAHVWPNGSHSNSVPAHSHDIHIDGRKVMAAVDPHIGKRLAMTSSGAYTRG